MLNIYHKTGIFFFILGSVVGVFAFLNFDKIVAAPILVRQSETGVILVSQSETSVITTNVSQATSPDLASGLVGYWSFDGQQMYDNIADSSGQGNTGYLSGQTSTTTVPGVIGQALSFDGVDDYITIGTGSDFNDLCINGCSFTAWVNPSIIDSTMTIIARFDFTGSNQFFKLQQATSEKLVFSIWENPGTVTTRCDTASPATTLFSAGNWSFITATYDPVLNESIVCIDNDCLTSVCTLTINQTKWSDTEDTFIGIRDDSSFLEEYNGIIDEARIYNRALSPSEITELYNQGRR